VFVYLDFSAYSDLAIGASRFFGLRVPENFDFPLLATSLGDFWQRWHITLTGLCRRHVYAPLLSLTRSPALAVFVTLETIAVWHAATLDSVLWGVYNIAGFYVYALYRRWRGPGTGSSWPAAGVGWLLTFAFIASSHAFTMTQETGDWQNGLRILAKLVGLDVLPR